MPIEDSEDILKDIAPAFRPYIQHLWRDLEFGLCKTKIDIERLRSSCDELSNQFSLVLPYCGRFLKWEVMFDHSAPWFAPDFRFDDDSFLNNANEDFIDQHVPSLSKWDEANPKALSKVISEFMELYRIHQTKLLSEDESSRAFFEYTTLLGDLTTSENDIEVSVGPGHSVRFLIRLNVDTSQLPELFHEEPDLNPGGESAFLLVRYPNPTGAELILSPLITRAVGNVNLPPMHQTGVLMDYVPMVADLLNKKMGAGLLKEGLKRSLLAGLLVRRAGAVLEHHATGAAFLFQINNFHWILQIDIGANCPEKAPELTLRSVYHASKGRPRTKLLPACFTHPTYPPAQLDHYLQQQAEIFKMECTGGQPNNQLINLDT